MSNLEFIMSKANNYDLIAEPINDNTLKVHSPKYIFDSWLIKEERDKLFILHKNRNSKKCTYHVQAVLSNKNKIRALQRINAHNKYVAFYKGAKKRNLVDRILKNETNLKLKH